MPGIGVERRNSAKWPELVVLLLWDYALFFLRAKAALYARCSLSDKGQDPGYQLRDMKQFCLVRGWEIYDEYVDFGYSGATDDRPGLIKMLESAERREFDAVCVFKLDRLARSLKHLVTTLDDFNQWGVTFVAIKDNIDYSSPSGRLLAQVMGSMAEFERSLLIERTKAGMAYARDQGRRIGAKKLHDYEVILELRKNGMSYREIAKTVGCSLGTVQNAIRKLGG